MISKEKNDSFEVGIHGELPMHFLNFYQALTMFGYYVDADWTSVSPVHQDNQHTITAPDNAVLISLGWQNEDNAVCLYAAQMFISADGKTGYIQVVNTSTTSTNVKFSYVYFIPDSEPSPIPTGPIPSKAIS